MEIWTLFILVTCTTAEGIFRQFVGTEQDKTYTIKCSDKDLSQVSANDATIKCHDPNTNCPTLTFTEELTIDVVNFPVSENGAKYDCTIGDEVYELLVGVLEPPSPEVKTENEGDTFEKEQEQAVLATCVSGYAIPEPIVSWETGDGRPIENCKPDNIDAIDTRVCFSDHKDADDRHNIELQLVADVKKDAAIQYVCKVTYYEAVDGRKVEKSSTVKFPENGCISVAGSTAKCAADSVDDSPVVTDSPTKKDETHDKPNSESANEHDGAGEDEVEEGGQMHNALLGTATGIVIFAIIVILIWFIRKKNRESEDDESNLQANQYKAGEQQQEA